MSLRMPHSTGVACLAAEPAYRSKALNPDSLTTPTSTDGVEMTRRPSTACLAPYPNLP